MSLGAGPQPDRAAPTQALPQQLALRSRQTVWVGMALAVAMAGLAGAFLAYEAGEIRRNQLARVELYAQALDDASANVVNGAETVLRSLQPAVANATNATALAGLTALLSDNVRDRPMLRSLSVLDNKGRVLASSNPDNLSATVPPGLLGATDGPQRGPRLGRALEGRDLRSLQTGPPSSTGVLALPMLMPVKAADQNVWLVALVNPDRIATQFERLLEGTELHALLASLDGNLIVATQGVNLPVGTSLRALPAFALHLPAREFASGVGLGSDGQQVTSAFRAARQWPLVVVVEQAEAAFRASLLVVGRWTGSLLLVAWALLAVSTWALRRALLRDERLDADLRTAHAATTASESRKLAILQSSLDAILTVDDQGRVVDFNRAAELMFGRKVADVLGRPMHELIVPAHLRQAHQAGMARYKATGIPRVLNQRIEVEAQRADGSLFPVELTIVPVRTVSGEMFTATLRDITERLRVVAALRDSEARARATFEQAAVGVLQQAADRRFLRVNQTLCRLLGYQRDEFLALKADDLIHPDDIAPGVEGMRRLFAGDISNFAQDKRFRCKSGAYLWVRLTASVARNDSGEVLYMIGIIEDISARRRAEVDLDAARLRELQIGARIQQTLLVTSVPPDIAGLQIGSYNQASQGIDGDFFEVISMGPHCVDLIAGDVMGKGLAAAMMGAATKLQFSRSVAELMTSGSLQGGLPRPSAVVAAVHRAMTPALQALDAFVTLCYLRIDTRRHIVTWVGCGHEETLKLSPGQAALALPNQHPPLGVLDSADYVEDECPLAPGDALFLYSDGMTDAVMAGGDRIGRERVMAAVAQRTRLHATPSAVLHGLRCDLLHDDVQLQDDLTMIAVMWPPAGSKPARIELPVQLQALRQVQAFVARHSQAAGLDEASCGLLEVACVEAFTNIVRHAIGLLPGAPIELVATRQRDALLIELIHVGEAFSPPEELQDTDFSVYPEGGFGLQIIRGASEEVQYLHEAGVNTLRMRKKLSTPDLGSQSPVRSNR